MLNYLGQVISSAKDKAEYDAAVKAILADKQVLAWILKWVTIEFADMKIEDIIPCIENPMVAEVPVFPGLTNEAIEGMKNESKIVGEGLITYDVRFNVIKPGNSKKKAIKIIVDVEGQKDPYPGYDLVTRGIFYSGRMLSDQMGRNLSGEDYDNLEKVYSIWIVFNCPQKNANTTVSYKIKPEVIHGTVDINNRYDLLTVIEVRLPDEENHDKCDNEATDFHNMLYDIFVRKEDSEEKMKRLEEKYNLKTKAMERRIKTMCNLSESVEEKGIKKGRIEGRIEGRDEINTLNKWLIDNNRLDDFNKSLNDPSYQDHLLDEMKNS